MNRFITCALLLAVAALLCRTPAQAVYYSWAVAGPDDMSVTTDWTQSAGALTGLVARDRLYINNGGVANMTSDVSIPDYVRRLANRHRHLRGTIGVGTVNQNGGAPTGRRHPRHRPRRRNGHVQPDRWHNQYVSHQIPAVPWLIGSGVASSIGR